MLDYQGTLTTSFKINDGTWTGVDLGSNGSNLVVGTPYTLGEKGGNIEMDGNIDNPHCVLNPTTKTLTITGQTSEAKFKYGIHGDIFGVTTWSTENMTESNGKWSLTKEIVAGNFGIKQMDDATGSQTQWISSAGAAAVTINTAMPCKVDGTNWSIGAGTYTFTYDPVAMTLTVSGEGGPVTYPEKLYIVGYVNGKDFAPNNTLEMTTGEDGVYTATGVLLGDAMESGFGYFQFATATGTTATDWSGLGTRYGASTADFEVTLGEPMALTNNDYSFMAEANKTYDFTVNLADKTVTVTESGDVPPIPVNPALYLRGDATGWSATADNKMTETDGVYTFTLPADKVLAGSFLIGGEESDFSDYKFTTGNSAMELDTEYNVTDDNMAGNMGMAADGVKNAVITFDYNTMKLKVTGEAVSGDLTYVVHSTLIDNLMWSALPMEESNGTWSLVVTPVNAIGQMLIISQQFGSNKDYFKAASEDVVLTLSETQNIVLSTSNLSNLAYDFSNGDAEAAQAENALQVKIEFNPATGAIKATRHTTGVEGIAIDMENAEFYNMNGIRVENPTNGIFIVRQGEKVSKVIL